MNLVTNKTGQDKDHSYSKMNGYNEMKNIYNRAGDRIAPSII